MAEEKGPLQRILDADLSEADISTKALIGAIVTFFVVVAITGAAAWVLVKRWAEGGPVQAPPPPSHNVPAAGPALQIAPPRDLEALRAREERLLHGAEWIDRNVGIARIPIEQAMSLLAKRAGGRANSAARPHPNPLPEGEGD
jgi:hypothetical protein